MTTTPQPDELQSSEREVGISIRNLERGQVVEVTVSGDLDESAVAGLGRQLHTIAAHRQPMTLVVDLAGAVLGSPAPVDSLTAAAATLDGFGGCLVVRGADAQLEIAMPAERVGRSLRFEHNDRPIEG